MNSPVESRKIDDVQRLRFVRASVAVLAFTLVVILWGAFVRITGSGAGCGDHWPLCNGEVIPRSPTVSTIIEFAHRLTSGLCLVAVAALAWYARRTFPARHPVRFASLLALLFVIFEALIGAGLVLFELVAQDASAKRALSMALHLANTLLLLGALALTTAWAKRPFAVPGRSAWLHSKSGWALNLALLGMLAVGSSGAIAALGDTLFPVRTWQEGIAQYGSPALHFLIQLRIWHPVLAVCAGLYTVACAWMLTGSAAGPQRRLWTLRLSWLVGLQLAGGVLNLALLAPAAMQIFHLLLADGVWLALVFFANATLAGEALQEEALAGSAGENGATSAIASSAR